jgi:hypothetical protein
MPIKRLVEGRAFDPEEVELLVGVFEAALRSTSSSAPTLRLNWSPNASLSLRCRASVIPFDCAKRLSRASNRCSAPPALLDFTRAFSMHSGSHWPRPSTAPFLATNDGLPDRIGLTCAAMPGVMLQSLAARFELQV